MGKIWIKIKDENLPRTGVDSLHFPSFVTNFFRVYVCSFVSIMRYRLLVFSTPLTRFVMEEKLESLESKVTIFSHLTTLQLNGKFPTTNRGKFCLCASSWKCWFTTRSGWLLAWSSLSRCQLEINSESRIRSLHRNTILAVYTFPLLPNSQLLANGRSIFVEYCTQFTK